MGDMQVLYRQFNGALVKRAYRKLRDYNAAEDAAHQVWVKVDRYLSRFDASVLPFKSWLYVILDRVVIDIFRANFIDGRRLVLVPHLTNVVARREKTQHHELATAVNSLDDKLRDAVHATYIKDQSMRDAAAELNIPLTTLQCRLEKAISLLQNRLCGMKKHKVRRRRTFSARAVA